MKFGIRHLLWLLFFVGVVLAIVDRVKSERQWIRTEVNYAIAIHRLDAAERKLDEVHPTWRAQSDVPYKFHRLPKPAVTLEGLTLAE